MAKGGDFEWVIAKAFSRWLTGGKDGTQLIRSVQSGGSARLKVEAAAPEYQVGDLAPNGPEGSRFRKYFGIECKVSGWYPDWWGYLRNPVEDSKWEPERWWTKLRSECQPFELDPLLVMRLDRQPMVVACLAHRVPREFQNFPIFQLPLLEMTVIKVVDMFQLSPDLWIQASGKGERERLTA